MSNVSEQPQVAEGKYIYCIIKSSEPRSFGPIGIGGRGDDVYTIHHEGLAAVVSNSPILLYDPTRENALAHAQVNETLLREYTVLPMAFGTLFRTDQDIVELLRSAGDCFRDVFTKMEGKLEFGLKVHWDRDTVISEIELQNEEIRNIKEQITVAASGSNYFARMQHGRLVEAALTGQAAIYVQEIYQGLRAAAVASRANKTVGDTMIMNSAFLVERGHEAEFDQKVKEIAAKYEGKLSFKYSGPWPPHNFVQIRLKLERAEAAGE